MPRSRLQGTATNVDYNKSSPSDNPRHLLLSGGSNPGLAGRLSWWAIKVETTQIADSSDTASQFFPGGVAAFPTFVGMTAWGVGNDKRR